MTALEPDPEIAAGRPAVGGRDSTIAGGKAEPGPRCAGSGPLSGRARVPLTIQVDAASAAVTPSKRSPLSVIRRLDLVAVSGRTSIETPATNKRPSVARNPVTPRPAGGSQATPRWGRVPRIEPTRADRTAPGPTSTNTDAPSAYIASIISANRTGLARWSPSRRAISAGSAGWRVASRLE